MSKLFHCTECPLIHTYNCDISWFKILDARRISGHSIQWNSCGIAETPDDVRLLPKHVVKGRSDRNRCIVDGIILCKKKRKAIPVTGREGP
jgi:hypothetical protein